MSVNKNISLIKNKKKNINKESLAAYLFISPWIIGFIIFLLIPLILSLYTGFTRWSIINPPPRWIGLDNFKFMFTSDRYFFIALRTTFRFIAYYLPASIVLGLSLALLLNQKLPGMNFFRTVFYIPAIVTGVGVSLLWLSLLDREMGAINIILRTIGVANPPNWINSPIWSVPSIALMSLWGVGGGAIIYLAGLQNIPRHLYEAAEIDGANRFQLFWKITLPLLSPTIFFMTITGLIGSFQVFQEAYILGGGSRGSAAIHMRFFVLHIYIWAFQEGRLGYGAALALVFIIIVAVVVLLAYRAFDQLVYYEDRSSR